ncbi:MAG: cytidylate kinase-like family protein [Oscillospiraceae bacterium]|nr:cytidylate kinase-like family protein [Oscillospiraceae bacterium]
MIITFGRQHGTRGYLIAQQLADQLGCRCYDKEILERAAENSHFSREILKSYDEKRVFPYFIPENGSLELGDFRLNMRLANAEFDAIRELADEGDAVFVGRCADYVLRERKDLVRVFITAERDFRIQTVVENSDLTAEQAKKLIKSVDKERANYYEYYTDQTWGDPSVFDLSLNVTRIPVEGAVQIIRAAVEAILQKQ